MKRSGTRISHQSLLTCQIDCSLSPEDAAAGLFDLDEDEGVADDDDDAGDGPGDEEPVGARLDVVLRGWQVYEVTFVRLVTPAVVAVYLQKEDCS